MDQSKAAKRSFMPLLLLLIPMLVGGCVTANFTEPITSFRDSVNATAGIMNDYYSELNSFEREVYLHSALYDASEVGTTGTDGKPTGLAGRTFSAESIKARTDAIVLLGAYVERLGELAGSEAPKQFADNAVVLGENLNNLSLTFQKLGRSDAGAKRIDSTAKNYAGPIATIVGAVGRMYLEKKRDAAVTAGVQDGAPAVRTVINLLQQDLTQSILPLEETGLKEELAELVDAYNGAVTATTKPSLQQREQMLTKIGVAAERYDAAIKGNPNNTLEGMRDAHEALVKYATSRRAPADFTELVTALETFKNNVNEIAAQVQKLRELRKGI